MLEDKGEVIGERDGVEDGSNRRGRRDGRGRKCEKTQENRGLETVIERSDVAD